MEEVELNAVSTINANFWTGKKVLLTGHTGFKGSWLSLWLHKLGAELTGYALAPATNPALFNEAQVGKIMTSIIGDIRDYEEVHSAVTKAQPEIIIHMAAQPLVRHSYNYPIETYSTNVMGTVHLLEAARKTNSVRAIVNVTTDKCYENKEWIWGYREDEPMGGFDPYSSSKGCSELISCAYRRSFYNQDQIQLATARAGNVIGGGDWSEDRLIPDILRAFESSKPAIIRNPFAIRPWQHVLEPLSGYLILAQKLYENNEDYASAWNFGPHDDDAKPVEWIVNEMVSLWGGTASWEIDDALNPHEANFLKLDISKARNYLGWEPLWEIKTALGMIIEWHQNWLLKNNIREVIELQIDEYLKSQLQKLK